LSALLPSYREACSKAKYLKSVSGKLARVPADRSDALKSSALEVLHMLSSLLIYGSYDAIHAVLVPNLEPQSFIMRLRILNISEKEDDILSSNSWCFVGVKGSFSWLKNLF